MTRAAAGVHDGRMTDVRTEPVEAADETMLGMVAPPTVPPEATADGLPDDRFLNREVSWLDFNARILALAQDRSAPLLERAKFLAIFATNLDEFFMVRVAGLKRRQTMGLGVRGSAGLATREQLPLIPRRSRELVADHTRCFVDDVRPALAEHGIRIMLWRDLPREQQ